MEEEKNKKYPSQDPALIKSRREIKQLEESLRRQNNKIEKLERENEWLKKENEKLKKELAAIRQPPKWAKANKTEQGQRKKRKPGAKKGHKYHPHKRPDKIDREVNLIPKQCPQCHHDLPLPHKWHEHIQIDIPPPPEIIVSRYHVGWSWCKHCQKEVSSPEKLSGSFYGPHLHGLVCYWKFGLGLTFGKIEKLLSDIYGLDISCGQLSKLIHRSASSFNGVYEDIKTSLLDQGYLYGDETGWRESGINHWLWNFSNHDFSYYHVDRSRSQKVVEDILGKSYRGVLVTDYYGGYNKINCSKQRCWAHLLRELRELKQKYPGNTEVKPYAKRIKRFYERGVKLKQAFQLGKNIEKPLKRLEEDTQNFSFQKHIHTDLKRLSKRLIKYRRELYVFIKSSIEPTNNHAEREIRPAVLMRKTSYCNRSRQGAKDQAILMSIIRTAHKRNQNFLNLACQTLTRDSPSPLSPPAGRGS